MKLREVAVEGCIVRNYAYTSVAFQFEEGGKKKKGGQNKKVNEITAEVCSFIFLLPILLAVLSPLKWSMAVVQLHSVTLQKN